MIVLLATPALLYVFCSVLIPGDRADVVSWREYFFKVRVPLFTSGILLALSVILGNQYLLGVPPLHSTQVGLYFCVVIFSTGALSRAARLHSALALMPPLLIVWVLVDMAPADWFSQ